MFALTWYTGLTPEEYAAKHAPFGWRSENKDIWRLLGLHFTHWCIEHQIDEDEEAMRCAAEKVIHAARPEDYFEMEEYLTDPYDERRHYADAKNSA